MNKEFFEKLQNNPKINRIIILNLDSFISSGGINKLIDTFHDRIVLICSSKRFGGKYGSFWQQFIKNLRRSGIRFVFYQSLNLVYYKIVVFIAGIINSILSRPIKIYSLNQLAQKYKIPLVKTKEINSKEMVSLIKEYNPDLIISFYFDQVIKGDIIGIPKVDIINVHTAMLPMCRGPFPILCSFLSDINGAITIHSIKDENLDVGPIYEQVEYDLSKDTDILSHDHDAMVLSTDIITNLLEKIENGVADNRKQTGEGSYMSFPDKDDIKRLRLNGIKLFSFKKYLNYFF